MPLRALLGLCCLSSFLAAVEPPKSLLEVAREQERWRTALGGLHCVYSVRQFASTRLTERLEPPAELYWCSRWETWFDRGLAHYRTQVVVDFDGFAKAVKQLAATRVSNLTPKSFLQVSENAILVASPNSSAYLPEDTGRLAIRKKIDTEEALPMETGSGILPVLRTMLVHQLTADGLMISPTHVNPYVRLEELKGVEINACTKTIPGPGQCVLTASLEFTGIAAEGDSGRKATLILRLKEIGAKGGPQFWVLSGCDGTIAGSSWRTEVVWRQLPNAECIAIPENIRTWSGKLLEEEVKLEKVDFPADLPISTWTIDPLLATSIYDEVEHRPILAAP